MIYLFNCDCCKQACGFLNNLCNCCSEQMKAIKTALGCHKPPFHQKPLFSILFPTGLLSLALLVACAQASQYTDTECKDSDSNVTLGFTNFLYILVFFALIAPLCVFYIGFRTWKTVLDNRNQPNYPVTDATVPTTASGRDILSQGSSKKTVTPSVTPETSRWKPISVPSQTVKNAFKDIFKYNLVTLLYFLMTLAVMVLCTMAPNNITHATDCEHSEGMRSLGMMYFWGTLIWCPLWWYCISQGSTFAEVPWDKPGDDSGLPTVVGQPVPAGQA